MSEYTDFSYDYAPSVSEHEVAETAGLSGSGFSASSMQLEYLYEHCGTTL